MSRLYFDFETRSAINLKKRGLDVYASDPSTAVLLIAWAIDDAPVVVHDHLATPELPDRFRAALLDPKTKKVAWNGGHFERTITKRVLGIDVPVEEWRDPSAHDRQITLPAALGSACRSLHLGEDEGKSAGSKLIKMFSELSKSGRRAIAQGAPATYFRTASTSPEEWAQFH